MKTSRFLKSQICLFLFLLSSFPLLSQELSESQLFSLRDNVHIYNYRIQLEISPENGTLKGSCELSLSLDSNTFAINLDTVFSIRKITSEGKKLPFKRYKDFIVIHAETEQSKIKVFYKGIPKKAKNPPWDGGIVLRKDKMDRPWVGFTCEGDGARRWIPCKDVQYERPDSVTVEISVPKPYRAISNGKLCKEKSKNGLTTFIWKNQYPINLYNITFYIGHYFNEEIDTDSIQMSYHVLDYEKDKVNYLIEYSQEYLGAFQKLYGRYPFIKDGYKVVQAPYPGMEHQTAIAYGDDFKLNSFGFDFILLHESAHEYWGNSVSASDFGDLWIHEAFATYTESLFLEQCYGKEVMHRYLNLQRSMIKPDEKILGPPDPTFMHFETNNLYYKGAWVLHTFRNTFKEDNTFFSVLRNLYQRYKYQIINTEDVISYFNEHTEMDAHEFFNYYLTTTETPILEYYFKDKKVYYRWASKKNFEMNMKILDTNKYKWIVIGNNWKSTSLHTSKRNEFRFLKDNYYIEFRELKK